ncbi:hypothetical protein HDU85_000443 [Gaertneriomyces sp. JEL0708]|nr:hypothetical protein HDU85_000443 [Gaertneriomyces sp. JEL0708]
MSAEICEACLQSPLIQAGIAATVRAYAKEAAEGYAAVGTLSGLALPFIAGNFGLAIWRLLARKPHARSWIILVSSLGFIIATVPLLLGVLTFENSTNSATVWGVIGVIVGLAGLCMAGGMRFAAPFTRRDHRRLVIGITALWSVVFAIAGMTLAFIEIQSFPAGRYRIRPFANKTSIMFAMLPIFYACAGLFCFSRQLRISIKKIKTASTNRTKMQSLEWANHVCISATLVAMAIYLPLLPKFKEHDGRFDSVTAVLFGSFCLMCENIFETLTDVMNDVVTSFAASSQGHATKDRSGRLNVPARNPDGTEMAVAIGNVNVPRLEPILSPQELDAAPTMLD